jgi:hypothetical protein
MITPIWNPLLLVGHPAWFRTQEPLSTEVGRSATEAGNPSSEEEDDPTDPRYRACLDLFELTRTPAIHLVHPASVSLMVLGSLTGNRADATPKLHSMFPRRPNTSLAGGPKPAQGEIPAEPTLGTGKGNQTPKAVVGIIIPAEDYYAPTLQAHSSGLQASRVEELADVALDSAVDFFLTVVDRSTSQALETVRLSCCRGEAALQKRHEGVPDDAPPSTLVLEALFHRYSGAIPLYLQVLTRPANSEGDWRAETDQSSGRVGPCINERDSEGVMRLRFMSLLHWTSLKKRWNAFFPRYPLSRISSTPQGVPCFTLKNWSTGFRLGVALPAEVSATAKLGFDEWVQLPPSQRLPDPDITNYVLSPDQFYAFGVIPMMNSLQFRSVCQFRPVLLQSGIPPVWSD